MTTSEKTNAPTAIEVEGADESQSVALHRRDGEMESPGDDAHTSPPATPCVAEVLTIEETADLLRVHRKTIEAMIRRGELPGARRCGRTYRIHRPSVISWLAASSRSARRGGRP